MKQLYLTEAQNAAFDVEYHSQRELNEKIAFIRTRWQQGARILDLGGGNGKFIDALLDAVPGSKGVMIEISRMLAERNIKCDDKKIIVGDIADLELHLKDQDRFDVITINWVLHHLVSENYFECKANCIRTLEKLSQRLAPGGCIIVAEDFFDGFFGSNVHSWIIFKITRIQRPYFLVIILNRFFNTSGVGVCFRSESAWKNVMRQGGLFMEYIFYGDYYSASTSKKVLLGALFLNTRRHGHMFCYPYANAGEIGSRA